MSAYSREQARKDAETAKSRAYALIDWISPLEGEERYAVVKGSSIQKEDFEVGDVVDVKWGKQLENSDVGTVIAMNKTQFTLHTSRRALEAGKEQTTSASVKSADSWASTHRGGPSKRRKGDAESRVPSEGEKKGKA
jgi:hypothetical protein